MAAKRICVRHLISITADTLHAGAMSKRLSRT
jgi:hypothetical protein